MNEISPKEVSDLHRRITQELNKVIVGQEQIVRLLLVSLFARGHCLLVGVPGLAKTLIVRALSEILQLSFKRIQFTPDLMPGDIIGSEILQEHERRLESEYQPGPIFANLLLADEINRTPPKTQAALLEAMQERKVTVGGQSRALPDPFLVVATQNPIEQEGTYPLPEAQLDRFMFSLYLNYPDKAEEIEIVKRTTLREMPALTPTVCAEDLLRVQRLVLAAPVSDHVIDYAVSLAAATRPGKFVVAAGGARFCRVGRRPARLAISDSGRKGAGVVERENQPGNRRCARGGHARFATSRHHELSRDRRGKKIARHRAKHFDRGEGTVVLMGMQNSQPDNHERSDFRGRWRAPARHEIERGACPPGTARQCAAGDCTAKDYSAAAAGIFQAARADGPRGVCCFRRRNWSGSATCSCSPAQPSRGFLPANTTRRIAVRRSSSAITRNTFPATNPSALTGGRMAGRGGCLSGNTRRKRTW